MEYVLDYDEPEMRLEANKVCPQWKSPGVPLAGILDNTRRWVHACEVGKCAEETQGGHLREVLQPWTDHHFALKDHHAAGEDIKACRNEDGIKASQCRHRCK